MAVLLENLKMLFIAEESVPGVCEGETALFPIAAFNAVYAPEFETVARMNLAGNLGIDNYYKNTRRPIFTFTTEVRGSGTADQPPLESPLYKAAGMLESILTATSVTYTFSSKKSDWKWLTVYMFYGDSGTDDYVVKACGVLLKPVLRVTPGQPMVIDWTAEGIFQEITTVKDFYENMAIPSFSKTDLRTPLPPTVQDGGCLQLDSSQMVSNSLEIDFGNEITHRQAIGCTNHGYLTPYLTARAPRGTMQIEIPNPDTDFDIAAGLVENSTHTLALAWGSVAGNQVNLAAEIQLLSISESPNGNISGWNVQFGVVGIDDDEFTLTFS